MRSEGGGSSQSADGRREEALLGEKMSAHLGDRGRAALVPALAPPLLWRYPLFVLYPAVALRTAAHCSGVYRTSRALLPL